jgi:hypothetical protein
MGTLRYLLLTDPDPHLSLTDPDPAIFVNDLQDAEKKLFISFCFLKVNLHYFSKIKRHKEVTKQ